MSQTTTARHEARADGGCADGARRNQQQALSAFLAVKLEIDTLLGQLQALSDEHFHAAPESVNWAHVGRLAHASDQLREVARFLGVEG